MYVIVSHGARGCLVQCFGSSHNQDLAIHDKGVSDHLFISSGRPISSVSQSESINTLRTLVYQNMLDRLSSLT